MGLHLMQEQYVSGRSISFRHSPRPREGCDIPRLPEAVPEDLPQQDEARPEAPRRGRHRPPPLYLRWWLAWRRWR